MGDKIIHKADLVSNKGDISPLCASKPRAINLKHESWTIVDKSVTCPKCLGIMRKAEWGLYVPKNSRCYEEI